MKKRALSLFLAAALLLICIPLGAVPVAAATEGDYTYTVENGEATITGYTGSATTLTIPDVLGGFPVINIETYAFYYHDKLTSLTIPSSVNYIGENSFYNCTSLASIMVDVENSNYSSVDGVLFNKEQSLLIRYPAGKSGIQYSIPDGVISVEDCAFSKCADLNYITFPDSVISIGESAFSYCSSLFSVDIPGGVATIKFRTFDFCTNLTSITIPNSVVCIEAFAFNNCESLAIITIPDSITSVGENAFRYCNSLTSIVVGKGNLNYCSVDGVLFNKDKTQLIRYPAGKTKTEYTIPDSVISIEERAFESCINLISVTISQCATSIGYSAFSKCYGLTNITLSDSVTDIMYYSFEYCSSLADVYYSGTEEQWAAISVRGGNDPLTNATIHYNSTSPDIDDADNGFTTVNDRTYYLIDGERAKGLNQVDGDYYYFSTGDGRMLTDRTIWAKADNICGLAAGLYKLGDDGKVQTTGFVTAPAGGTYYYEDLQLAKGLKQIDGDYYYFSTGSGKMAVSKTIWVKASNPYGLAAGNYTIGEDGKLIV